MFLLSGKSFEIFKEFKCLKIFSSSPTFTLKCSARFPYYYSSKSSEVAFKMHKRGFIVNFTVAASLWLF